MSKEHIISNTKNSNNGNSFKDKVYNNLKDLKNIKEIELEKRFYPKETVADIILKRLKLQDVKKEEKIKIEEEIEKYFEENKDKVIRTDKKFYKQADITFLTTKKYLLNNKKTKIRIIMDTTTSERIDRTKAKAQDSFVYNAFDMDYIYFIILPNDDYFDKYANPEKEIKSCEKAIYNHNFKNLYKEEKVSLILQENDLINFLEYIKDKENQNIEDLMNEWKKNYYKKMYLKYKNEMKEYKEKLYKDIINLYE